jgi:hypothetical protein
MFTDLTSPDGVCSRQANDLTGATPQSQQEPLSSSALPGNPPPANAVGPLDGMHTTEEVLLSQLQALWRQHEADGLRPATRWAPCSTRS